MFKATRCRRVNRSFTRRILEPDKAIDRGSNAVSPTDCEATAALGSEGGKHIQHVPQRETHSIASKLETLGWIPKERIHDTPNGHRAGQSAQDDAPKDPFCLTKDPHLSACTSCCCHKLMKQKGIGRHHGVIGSERREQPCPLFVILLLGRLLRSALR